MFSVRFFLRESIFLEPSSTHTCECSRAGGYRSRRESRLPGDSVPVCTINSQEWWIYALFLNVVTKTTTTTTTTNNNQQQPTTNNNQQQPTATNHNNNHNNNHNHHHHQGSNRFPLLFGIPFCSNLNGWLAMAERDDAGGGTGSARQRRERRLRSFLRHERMSVATATFRSILPNLHRWCKFSVLLCRRWWISCR